MRITQGMMTDNMIGNIQYHSEQMDRIQQNIASQRRIRLPDENPNDAGDIMIYRSRIERLTRYEENSEEARNRLNNVDANIQQVLTSIHRLRELAVQGANGIYTHDDRIKMAVEIEQQLRHVVSIANSTYAGESTFGGTNINHRPYLVEKNRVIDPRTGSVVSGGPVISNVQYQGDIGLKHREVDRGEFMAVNVPGVHVFWATNMTITAGKPGTGYVANRDMEFRIDGVTIKVNEGDNLETIVNKINSADVAVKATIDNTSGQNLLVLNSTRPHQVWVEDIGGGTVLQDLGIVAEGGPLGPNNYSPTANVQGNSMFDAIIKLRDSLFRNDVNGVNQGLGLMDEVINNLTQALGEVGGRQRKTENLVKRHTQDKLYTTEIYSKLQSVDMAEAIMQLRAIEDAHRAALQVGAKILRPTLLDFMR